MRTRPNEKYLLDYNELIIVSCLNDCNLCSSFNLKGKFNKCGNIAMYGLINIAEYIK